MSTPLTPQQKPKRSFDSPLASYLLPESNSFTSNSLYSINDNDYKLPYTTINSGVDLSEELANQIEYNNNLLKELQSSERKSQDLNRELSSKDQELRQVRQENASLLGECDKLQEELYKQQLQIERLQNENSTMREQLDFISKSYNDLQDENKELMDKLEMSSQQLSDRNREVNELHADNIMLKDNYSKLEDEYQQACIKLDEAVNKMIAEKNQLIDIQKVGESEKNDLRQEIERLYTEIDNLKREIELHDKDRQRILLEKEDVEKRNYNLESQIQSQEFKTNDKIRQIQIEYDQLMKDSKMLAQEYSSLKSTHYKYLGDVQVELRELHTVALNTREKYTILAQEIRNASSISNTILSFENGQSEILLNELRNIVEDRNKFSSELQQVTDRLQSTEVALEEERTKAIMFEEKASKHEQQFQEVLQKFRNTERELNVKYSQQVERYNYEVENNKIQSKRMEEEIANLKKGQQSILKIKTEAEERERKAVKENRVLIESIRKLQRQLEETKKYLTIVQNDRTNINNEKESLRKELHEIISSQRMSSFVSKSMNPLSFPSSSFTTSTEDILLPNNYSYLLTSNTKFQDSPSSGHYLSSNRYNNISSNQNTSVGEEEQ
ncbi:hypothetical protein ABK040_006634 [Willaertia magna]